MTKQKKKESLEVLEELGYIPLIYKGNITTFDNIIYSIIVKHFKYEKFIKEYFSSL